MAKRLCLHIGTPKSGTTYLQEWAGANAAGLLSQGILWPDLDRYPIVRDLAGRAKLESDLGAWREFCQQVRDFDGVVLFSNEMMVTLQVPCIERIVEETGTADVVVVITARDLGRVIPSQWQTSIRNGGTVTWGDYAGAICRLDADDLAGRQRIRHGDFWGKHDIAEICQRWGAVLGPETVCVVTVPRESSDVKTLTERFSLAVGFNAADLPIPEESVNTSLGAHSVELLRLLNGDLKNASRAVRKHVFRDLLAKVVLTERASIEPRYGLTSEQTEVIVRRSQQISDRLIAMRVPIVGDLRDLIPTDGGSETLAYPEDATPAELLAAARQGMVGLLQLLAETLPK
jgi:hypothetical protein